MWQLGVAFVRGLNIYGRNRITQRRLMRALKELEGDDLQILRIVKTNDVIFKKNGIHYSTAGSRIERKLKEVLKKDIYVTTRSIKTLERVQTSADKLKKVKNLSSYQKISPPTKKPSSQSKKLPAY